MTYSARDTAYHRLADGSRILAVLIVGVPIVADRSAEAITALLAASLVWLADMATESRSRVDVVAHYQVAQRSKLSRMRYY